jgi:hypothetical protein
MAAWNPGSLAQRSVFAINGTEKDALNQLPCGKEKNVLSKTNHYSEGIHWYNPQGISNFSNIGDQFTESLASTYRICLSV